MMPMGVTNGNAAFRRVVENLHEPVRDCVDPFDGDVIIASGDPSMSFDELLEAHESNVTEVLDLQVSENSRAAVTRPPLRIISEVVFAHQRTAQNPPPPRESASSTESGGVSTRHGK